MTAPESRRCVDILADVMAAERDDHGQPIGEHPELASCLPGAECGCPCHSMTSGMYGMYASHIAPCCYPEGTAVARVNTPAELACRQIRELAESWRYKGEFGWGPWQAGEGPDPEGFYLDIASGRLLAVLDRLGA